MSSTLLEHAQYFRDLAKPVWSEETAFPGQFDPANISRGQCGVTSYCFGLWLAQRRGFDLSAMSYDRGELRDGSRVVGPNQSWLGIIDGQRKYRADLTLDQYAGVTDSVVVVPERPEPDDPPFGLRHIVQRTTPLAEYDTAKMRDRIAVMVGALELDLPLPIVG